MIPEVLRKMLPPDVTIAADKLNVQDLYEIRLRSERCVAINYCGKFYYLGAKGTTQNINEGIIVTAADIKNVLVKATEYSLYAVNNQICEGYLTVSGGIRIGISGETVWSDSTLKTIKNYNALNIRLPHQIKGCSDLVVKNIVSNGVKNTILVSPPGAGKTTILRDIARVLGSGKIFYNVLVVDERNEIAAMNEGKSTLDIGANTDVINGCTKKYAFSRAVRAMRPDIIITDELFDEQDVAAVQYAMASGVAVIASVHALNHLDLFNKPTFDDVIKKKLFSRYVNISDKHGPGTIEGIFDEEFRMVYCP